MDEAAERTIPHNLFAYADDRAINTRFAEPKLRLPITAGGPLEDLAGGSRVTPCHRVCQRIEGIAED
jgi:hypothetical protein